MVYFCVIATYSFTVYIIWVSTKITWSWKIDANDGNRLFHGTPKRTEIEKKIPVYDTHIFWLGIPQGSQKCSNENIWCVSWRENAVFLTLVMKMTPNLLEKAAFLALYYWFLKLWCFAFKVKITISRQEQDTHRIFSFEHFCDPWGIPNQKIWVSYLGIFFSISVFFGAPWGGQLLWNEKTQQFVKNSIFIMSRYQRWTKSKYDTW